MPRVMNEERSTPGHINVTFQSTRSGQTDRDRDRHTGRREKMIYKGFRNKIALKTTQKSLQNPEVLRENNFLLHILYVAKMSIRYEGKIIKVIDIRSLK